jgi:DNA-binding CsgD family transcriptional regulator
MGTGIFREELGVFQRRFNAAVVSWMPITQSVGGVTCFTENTILGELAIVGAVRNSIVGHTLTSSWDPSAPLAHEINHFALPIQMAKRDENPIVLEEIHLLYGKAPVEDTLRMLVYDGALCLGWFGLLRADDADDFSAAELRHAQAEERLWSARLVALQRRDQNLLRTAAAHIVVDDAGKIVAASREVEAWLTRSRRERVAEAAAHIRREGTGRLLIDRYSFDGVTISNGTSSLVYLNAPLGTFGSVALCVLSHRQRQVADLVSIGMSNAECAEELSLSVHTVKQHLAAAFRLLGVSRREELVVMLRTRNANELN